MVFAILAIDKMKIDDPVGAISVHGVVGMWGLIAVAITNPEASLKAQLIGLVTIFVWTFITSFITWLVIKAVMGIRVSEEEEFEGVDLGRMRSGGLPGVYRNSRLRPLIPGLLSRVVVTTGASAPVFFGLQALVAAVAKGPVTGMLAAAKPYPGLFADLQFHRREVTALVRAIAKRLTGGFATGAPPVSAGFQFHGVGGSLGDSGFGHVGLTRSGRLWDSRADITRGGLSGKVPGTLPQTSWEYSMFDVSDLTRPGLPAVSFRLGEGELACLSGPSGSGKTQLLRALVDLDSSEGSVTLLGVRRESLPPQQWRRRVAFLPAESRWWAATVAEHFAVVDAEQLRRLGFDEDVADWRVERLSSGEKQRLALLRLLANRPEVLLLDEPTANLDAENIERVEKLVTDYVATQRASCLWVSHDERQITRLCERCLEMADAGLRETT